MNKQASALLEQHFDTTFSAPNGIKKLRELILTLAMQGKLVAQDPNDSPASQLLKEIEAEKKRLAKESKIKTPKPLPEISSGDAPYALSQGWQWVRLGSVGNIFNGNSINASEKEAKYAGAEGLPYIATKDVGYGFDPLDYENGICIPVDEDKFRVAHEGAVLICAEGGSAGKKCGLTNRDICFGNKLFANELYGQIPSRFILFAYLSPVFRASFVAAMTGIIGGVSIAKFVEIPIPLPPLEEQHRIVAKIDQLMARCDALEKLRKARDDKRLAVHAAALSQLLDSSTPSFPRRRESSGSKELDSCLRGNDEGFSGGWQFLAHHFADLYIVKENVAELRKAILQLAVMGKLIPQDPNDPPAVAPLGSILAEASVNGVSKGPTTDTSATEILRISAGTSQSDFYVDEGDFKYVDLSNNEIEKFQLAPNDLLACRFNGNLHYVGKFSLYRGISSRVQVNPDKLIRFRIDATTHSARYVCYMMNAAPTRQEIEAMCATTAGNIGLSAGKLKTILIPLPSLEEQQRIVAKIDQLMALCDTLDQQIAAATNKQTELLNAVMAEV